jgi:uncharacterized protein YbjT (DUF2867 family)
MAPRMMSYGRVASVARSVRYRYEVSNMILVTCANGNQGKHLIPKLLAAGRRVRAVVQSANSAEQLCAKGVSEVLVGDISTPETCARAVAGVTSVYHLGPNAHTFEREMGIRMVDAAREAGVQHFVFSSVLHAITRDLVQHEIKREIEEHLVSSGLEFTILQPANYMMPFKLWSAFEEGVFRLSWSLDRRQSMVDLDDVTDVVVKVLNESSLHFAATYELAGSARYTAHEIGAIISNVLGREIAVQQVTGEDNLRAFFGADADMASGKFDHQLRVFRAISAYYSNKDFIGNPNTLRWLLGREPTSYEEFVRKEYKRYLADKSDGK